LSQLFSRLPRCWQLVGRSTTEKSTL